MENNKHHHTAGTKSAVAQGISSFGRILMFMTIAWLLPLTANATGNPTKSQGKTATPTQSANDQHANATTYVLHSPDGRYQFRFLQQDNHLWYDVSFEEKEVIGKSELGIDIDNRLFESALGIQNEDIAFWGENLQVYGCDTTTADTTWHPVYGENNRIRDHYNQLTIHLGKGQRANAMTAGYDKRFSYEMDVEIRAYDEGVAFRYHFPEQNNGLFLNITGERTAFVLPQGTQAFYEEWAQGPYHKISLAEWPKGRESERPLLLRLPDGRYAALLEARMTDYARGKFAFGDDGALHVKMYDGAEIMSPYSTPWRVIMVGDKAVDLINHKDLVLNLNDPCLLTDTRYIKPGKVFRCCRLDWQSILKGIHFAENQHMQYIELDAGWYGPEQMVSSSALRVSAKRDFTIPAVVDSARSHGLGVLLYVNQRALYHQLDSILPIYRKWGVAGIKFGFVQVGNQMWTTWLHNAVRRCADYGLLADIHDEYRPTGFSRTYPNLMTQEGVMGNETMPDARHDVTLPFTRYLCGPADFTPCYYNRRTTHTYGHQLAMAAVYYSPLQFLHWYGDPKVYDGGEELQFWRDIPTVFDESKAVDGEPGEWIVQARRSGNEWYVGCMTNEKARDIVVRTSSFLTPGKCYVVECYEDDPTLTTKTKVACRQMTVKGGRDLRLHLQSAGGACLHFKPAK